MEHAAWINAPFAQPGDQGTSVPASKIIAAIEAAAARPLVAVPAQGAPTPGLVRPALPAPAPVAPGHDDSVIAFRSWLLREQRDGVELRAALDRMVARAPEVAAQVIFAGSLGGAVMGPRAAECLREYLATGVATAPMCV
jgi:hypothetical protein